MRYTYDSLNKVIKRQVISLDCDCVVSEENYNYDAADNITEGNKRTVPLSLSPCLLFRKNIYRFPNRFVALQSSAWIYNANAMLMSRYTIDFMIFR